MIALPATVAAIEAGMVEGLHLGAQLYVSRHGERLELALGERSPGVPLAPDDLVLWMSAVKPVTAVAVAQLWEEGRLALDDAIARHLPAFAAGGKEAITIRQALTHTGGFRMLDVGWPRLGWEETIAGICAARREPRWEPGHKAGYHNASSWFILGALVEHLAGVPFATYVRERIFAPAGLGASSVGLSPAEHARLAPRLCPSWDMSGDAPRDLGWHSERFTTRTSPAGGGRGPIRELGAFYEMLLAGGRGPAGRLLTPQTVEALTARHRVGMYDHTFKHVMDWGLGLIPDSKQYGEEVPYAYGPLCSPRTYGHSGYRSVCAFADPEHGLAVAIAWNGLPADAVHEARTRTTLEALYRDLGLAAVA